MCTNGISGNAKIFWRPSLAHIQVVILDKIHFFNGFPYSPTVPLPVLWISPSSFLSDEHAAAYDSGSAGQRQRGWNWSRMTIRVLTGETWELCSTNHTWITWNKKKNWLFGPAFLFLLDGYRCIVFTEDSDVHVELENCDGVKLNMKHFSSFLLWLSLADGKAVAPKKINLLFISYKQYLLFMSIWKGSGINQDWAQTRKGNSMT